MMLQLHWAQNAVGPAEVSGDVLPEPYRKALGRKLASKRRPCIKQSCSTTMSLMSLWTHGKSIAMIKSHRINMTRTSFREYKAFQCAQNFVSPAAFNVCQRGCVQQHLATLEMNVCSQPPKLWATLSPGAVSTRSTRLGFTLQRLPDHLATWPSARYVGFL